MLPITCFEIPLLPFQRWFRISDPLYIYHTRHFLLKLRVYGTDITAQHQHAEIYATNDFPLPTLSRRGRLLEIIDISISHRTFSISPPFPSLSSQLNSNQNKLLSITHAHIQQAIECSPNIISLNQPNKQAIHLHHHFIFVSSNFFLLLFLLSIFSSSNISTFLPSCSILYSTPSHRLRKCLYQVLNVP